MGFEKISGNPRVRDYLTAIFTRKTVPHAFLISGNDEEEKEKLAKILAGAIVCVGENAPCDTCAACKKASGDNHPDIIWLRCESASIKVDEIRAIRKDAYLLPNDGEKKVYIIDDADKMTQEAQDALLKILEEPPRFTTFILLCYNHNSLLTTVMSRVTHLKLQSIAEETVEPEIASPARSIAEAISTRNELEILKALISCEKKKRDEMSGILSHLILILRDGAIISAGGGELLSGEECGHSVGKALSVNEILKITDAISDARTLISRNVGVAHIVAKCAVEIYASLI